MRFLQLLLITLILASCGTGKIKYVRVKGQPQQLVEVKTEKEGFNPTSDLTTVEKSTRIESVISKDVEPDVSEPETTESTSLSPHESKEYPNETIDEPEDNKREKVRAALRAERRAISGHRTLMISVIFLGISMVPLGFTQLLFLPALILLIIGAVKIGKANRSRYITPEGQRAIDRSKPFIITWIVWAALMLILTGMVILFFW